MTIIHRVRCEVSGYAAQTLHVVLRYVYGQSEVNRSILLSYNCASYLIEDLKKINYT